MAIDVDLHATCGNCPAFELGRLSGSRVLGRWALTAAVLAWFAVLILVPAMAPGPAGLSWWTQAVPGRSEPARSATGLWHVHRNHGPGNRGEHGFRDRACGLVLTRQRFWGRALVDGVVDLPFAISPIVAGLMLIVLYGPDGWLGRWLEPHGIRVVYAVPGMILATMFVTVPFVVRELVPVLRELGEEYEQAAHTLGAGRWRTFWSVTLPSIRWGVAYGVTLTVARSLGEFGAILVVSGNVIGQTQTATLYIEEGVESFHPEGAYAASLVLAAFSFILLIGMDAIRNRLDRRGRIGHDYLGESIALKGLTQLGPASSRQPRN